MPRLVHSLDLAAEDTDSEAYRDLLREIDRAFQSFDHMAVRHGWLSGGETQDATPAEADGGMDLHGFRRLGSDAGRGRLLRAAGMGNGPGGIARV